MRGSNNCNRNVDKILSRKFKSKDQVILHGNRSDFGKVGRSGLPTAVADEIGVFQFQTTLKLVQNLTSPCPTVTIYAWNDDQPQLAQIGLLSFLWVANLELPIYENVIGVFLLVGCKPEHVYVYVYFYTYTSVYMYVYFSLVYIYELTVCAGVFLE